MDQLDWLQTGVYLCFLPVICIIDFRSHRIPNKLLLCMLAVRVLFLMLGSMPEPWQALLSSAAAAAVVGAAYLLLLPLLQKNIGPGDIKLLITTAFCFGFDFFIRCLAGCALALLILLAVNYSIRKHQQRIPFAPCVLAGMLPAILSYCLQ